MDGDTSGTNDRGRNGVNPPGSRDLPRKRRWRSFWTVRSRVNNDPVFSCQGYPPSALRQHAAAGREWLSDVVICAAQLEARRRISTAYGRKHLGLGG